MNGKKRISVVVKTTNACNLHCKYCYDANKLKKALISVETIGRLIDVVSKDCSSVNFIWHGGEPMLMGMDFYSKVLELQREYPEITFDNHIQTNGTLIDDDWAKFFIKNNFHVGISYDGGKEETGRERQEDSMRGRNIMAKHGVQCGVLTVVNNSNVDDLQELYEKYKDSRVSVQFNCIFPSGEALENKDLVISAERYTFELSKLFDIWLFDKSCRISVEPFIGYIRAFCGENTKCVNQGCLYRWLCLNWDGNVYPCGKITDEKYKMGNIHDVDNIDDLYHSDVYTQLALQTIYRRDDCGKDCKWFKYCSGGCNADALMYGELAKNNHAGCVVYQEMMEHIQSKLSSLTGDDKDKLNPFVVKYFEKLKENDDLK